MNEKTTTIYKIEATYQGGRQNHAGNALARLDGQEFATREDACEAIHSALYDIIEGENGVEFVDRPDWASFPDTAEGNAAYEAAREAYSQKCRAYIFDNGSATEDGVSVSVNFCEADNSAWAVITTDDDGTEDEEWFDTEDAAYACARRKAENPDSDFPPRSIAVWKSRQSEYGGFDRASAEIVSTVYKA